LSLVNELLTNEELAGAITDSFGKIDALLMMNCVMMNVHTTYAFKDCVKFLIGPKALFLSLGYDYLTILNEINSLDLTSRQVAKRCLETSFSFENVKEDFMKKK
jgi:hypothetical protein